MLTKGDLSAIKSIVSIEVKNEIQPLKDELIKLMDKNTNDIVELITTNSQTVESVLQNHEKRLTHIESISFKSN